MMEGDRKVYKVETYAIVRHAYYNDGKSQREIARQMGVNRRTIQRMLQHSTPPGYARTNPPQEPILSEHKTWIDEILEADKKVHRKQKHTAKQIYDRLKEERAFAGSYTTVRTYVAKKRLKSREMFVPLSHAPGMAQVDFGQAQVKINGVACIAHFFVMQLPFSDAVFVKAYPAENTEAFADGHQAAFLFFGGVSKRILYDNTTIAVKKILKDGKREQTRGFVELRSHFLFEEAFAAVARGNEKGGVENLIGFVRRNFMVPLPDFESFEVLNAHLATCCKKRQLTVVRGSLETIGQRLARESFLPLPQAPYEACRVQCAKITSQGLVRFDNNDYSVPTTTGQQKVWIKGFVDRVVVAYEDKVIAEHPRSYSREDVVFNPLHYLKLLERKTGAFVQAAPLKGWKLPAVFQKVHDILYKKDGKEGRRSYIRILQFLENFSEDELQQALEQSIKLMAVTEPAILHLLKRNKEKRPPNLSLLSFPKIPVVHVAPPNLCQYSARLLTACRTFV
jgi:transposase